MKYITKVLLGLDQFANTIIGGAPDETISARSGRLRAHPVWKQLAWCLDHIQKDHVEEAIAHERDGSQQDPSYIDVYKAGEAVASIKVDEQKVTVEVAKDVTAEVSK